MIYRQTMAMMMRNMTYLDKRESKQAKKNKRDVNEIMINEGVEYVDTYIVVSMKADNKKSNKKKKISERALTKTKNNRSRNRISFLNLLLNINHNRQHYHDFIQKKEEVFFFFQIG
jgi:argininosuccinate lyase